MRNKESSRYLVGRNVVNLTLNELIENCRGGVDV